MPVTDTSPAAHARQLQLYRDAGPDRRVAIAAELSDALREICCSGVRMRHPEYSDVEVRHEVLRIFYGRDGNSLV
jgi:hypothetical protein